MIALVLSLALAGPAPDEPLPAAMSLDEPRARQEQDPQRPEDGRMGVMEHVYRFSELEAGMLWTFWDKDLDLENDVGAYVRYGVGVGADTAVTVAYRHYDYTNSELPGGAKDDVLLRAFLVGLAYRHAIDRDFEISGQVAGGFMRWDSSGAGMDDDTGPAASAEGAVVVRLHEVLRFRAAAALDWARTEFHEDSRENVLSLSLLLGLELGGR
jgi:hypothetical protein